MVFDLDGTLTESKQRVSAAMGELVAHLLQKMPVAVMSWALFQQFENQLFTALPPEAKLERLYIFPNNAAQCFVHKNGAWHPQYDKTNDTTPSVATKAYGVARLAELTGIAIPHMLYVGDALEEGGNDAVVVGTGIPTHAVFGPTETAALIESMIKLKS